MPALMQIVAYGQQDVYLTGNPDITHFKTVYRRHTNFSLATVENKLTKNGFGSKSSASISRNGDLMCGAYLRFELPDISEKALENFALESDGWTGPNKRYMRWVDNVGHYLIKSVSIEINGQTIDSHTGDWLEVWAQLSLPASKRQAYREMIGQDPLNAFGQNTGLQRDVFRTNSQINVDTNISFGSTLLESYTSSVFENTVVGRTLLVPLQFWFCRDWGMSLPLVALQNAEVRIHVELEQSDNLIMVYEPESGGWVSDSSEMTRLSNLSSDLDVSLFVDYAFLDVDERRKFRHVSHEYLIEQLQTNSFQAISGTDEKPQLNNLYINFDHPVKELVWVVAPFTGNKEWSNYTNTQLRGMPPTSAWSTGNLDNGLSGLPVGDQDYFDIDVYLQLPANDTLTVVSDISLASQSAVFFTVHDTMHFAKGDMVVINDGSDTTNTTLLVNAVDENYYPTEFVVHNQPNVNVALTNVVKVDRVATGFFDITIAIQFNPNTGTYLINDPQINPTNVFAVNDRTTFVVGDVVVLKTPNDFEVELTVGDVDVLGHPTFFELTRSDPNYPTNLSVEVTKLLSINGQQNSLPIGLDRVVTYNDLVNFSSYHTTRPCNALGLAQNPVRKAQLIINNYKRFQPMSGMYFNLYQPYRHHTNVPESPGINVYSFSIEPESSQPSGACNFSRLDNTRLDLYIGGFYDGGAQGQQREAKQQARVHVFALGFNVLRIFCGMGGLAFSG